MSGSGKLRKKAKRDIASAAEGQPLVVSDILLWEILLSIQSKRVEIGRSLRDWLEAATAAPLVDFQHIHQRSQCEMLDATELVAGRNRCFLLSPFGYGGTGRSRFAEAQMLGKGSGADKKDIYRANVVRNSLVSAALTVLSYTLVPSYAESICI